MKKIFLSLLIVGSLFTSCNMDEEPIGSLSDETAIESPLDALKFRNGLYVQLRSLCTGSSIVYAEMQADMFIGVQGNGNRLGFMSLGNILPNSTDLEAKWSYPYSMIAAVNYYIPKLDAVMANPAYADSEATLKRYRAEAYFVRAYAYYFLADHYCNSYNRIDPNKAASGLPLLTSYDPSGEYDKYSGRSTLAEVFDLIDSDLKTAYDDLKTFQASADQSDLDQMIVHDAPYLSTYGVAALQARIALLKGDNSTAISKAEEVIAGPFTLTTIADYSYLWYDDSGDELIFLPYADNSQSDAVSTIGANWITAKGDQADYVATSNCLEMYDAQNDVRYEWFFEPRDLVVNGETVTAPNFVKYPGNYEFNTGSTNSLKNLAKPFRLSEMYLIVAEAAASSDASKANKMLNDLRKERIYNYQETSYSGQSLVEQIRLERTKELIGEGYRISDLRRWGLGFSREVNYTGDNAIYSYTPDILLSAGKDVKYIEDDTRYVWPIPTGEMETNPQLAGQQNPGY